MPKSAQDQPPDGYDELGESLAQVVVEGSRSQQWAIELAMLAGYSRRQTARWVKHYRATNEEELKALERRQQAKSNKINALRRKSAAIRQELRAKAKPDQA